MELLNAYLVALDNKDAALTDKTGSVSELAQIASDARTALKDGLESVGYTLGSVLGWQEWKDWPGDEPLDLERIAAAIAALDDADETKLILTQLLATYQTALDALTAAGETPSEELQEAEKDAKQALMKALYEAGLLPLAEDVPEEGEPAPEA